ncbi:hypothetical protein PSTG_04188 [Puccinia striiformis f. sp. tritici PST-78]|uniref:Uncharacterized protein n=1 Tax=Puccinia striiformis f. sp. tritici PST-78 TaxID=1165861 RepID=A0A0L0VTI4_9BASI|nr:hypothetical protein PSTG_04188 [Puccinia striiformis f. sp. tritici PST-78]
MNEKKTLHQRRDLQHTHRFKKLNETVKIEAQNLIVDYQRRQHSFFQQKDASAQKALRDTNNNVGQQNKPASKLYQSVTNTAETDDSTTDHSTGPPADDPKDPNTAERNEAPLLTQHLGISAGAPGVQCLLAGAEAVAEGRARRFARWLTPAGVGGYSRPMDEAAGGVI